MVGDGKTMIPMRMSEAPPPVNAKLLSLATDSHSAFLRAGAQRMFEGGSRYQFVYCTRLH